MTVVTKNFISLLKDDKYMVTVANQRNRQKNLLEILLEIEKVQIQCR